jgi:hypothetical protein
VRRRYRFIVATSMTALSEQFDVVARGQILYRLVNIDVRPITMDLLVTVQTRVATADWVKKKFFVFFCFVKKEKRCSVSASRELDGNCEHACAGAGRVAGSLRVADRCWLLLPVSHYPVQSGSLFRARGAGGERGAAVQRPLGAGPESVRICGGGPRRQVFDAVLAGVLRQLSALGRVRSQRQNSFVRLFSDPQRRQPVGSAPQVMTTHVVRPGAGDALCPIVLFFPSLSLRCSSLPRARPLPSRTPPCA